MARWTPTFTVTAPGSPGTTSYYSTAQEVPRMSRVAAAALISVLTGLTGGTSPTVASVLQGSLDNSTWVDVSESGAASVLSHSANGAQSCAFQGFTKGNLTEGLASWRYLRLRCTGGGTAAPTAWAVAATLNVVWDTSGDVTSRWSQTLSIAAVGSPGTTAQYSSSSGVEIPDLGPQAAVTCVMSHGGLTGGTSPTVTGQLEVSLDRATWIALPGPSTPTVPLSTSVTSYLYARDDSGLLPNLGAYRYTRLKGTGGGTAAPTAWTLTAKIEAVG